MPEAQRKTLEAIAHHSRILPVPDLGEENYMKKILLLIAAISFSLGAVAHSGGTDKNGCHQDRKNGGSHCH